jgi:hypothetical protein
MIEEFANVIGHALGLKKLGKNEEGLNELREAYQTWFALDKSFLATCTPAELLAKISGNEDFPPPKIEALARGLMTEADLISPADPAVSDRREKALVLFRYLEEVDSATFSLTRRKFITDLDNSLRGENE